MAAAELSADVIAAVRRGVLEHYWAHRRDLPWRRTKDPYAIWVSEIMLQQTQVDTVVPYYQRFMARFPTVSVLAAASEEGVCEAWAGLGYYRRARFLHRAARQVQHEYGGALPEDAAGWQGLTGVGRYTAGAIASIALGQQTPLVDGNVARVLARLFNLADVEVDSTAGEKQLWAWAAALVPARDPGDFNQGLMELGATVCTPKSPSCDRCPVAAVCAARAAGPEVVAALPKLKPKAAAKLLPMAFAWAVAPDGRAWLERRPLDGLWAGLWEPPSAAGRGAKAQLAARLEPHGARLGSCIGTVEHQLTHRQVRARVYAVRGAPDWPAGDQRRLTGSPLNEPLSTLARKVIRAAIGAGAGGSAGASAQATAS